MSVDPDSGTGPAGVEVLDDALTRTVYSTDNSVYQIEPAAIALPRSAAEVAALLKTNSDRVEPRPIGPRGGGTGTNGQSLTDGLMIDVKRHLNKVHSIDPVAQTATVDPGVVTAELNRQLAAHGLYWAPHTSTLNRATVGGMISTDAAGKGSMIHGRAHRHVARLEVCLVDGTPWIAEPVTVDEAHRRAAIAGAGGELWTRLLALPIVDGQRFDLPELARGFSGYGIDRFRRDGIIDPTALMCGAEGTLGFITQATLKLTPLPANPRLVVAAYPTFRVALDDAVRLRTQQPSAIECFDATTLEQGRGSTAWPAFEAAVGDHDGAVLLVEFTDDSLADAALVQTVLAGGTAQRAVVVADRQAQDQIWKVRADAVGLLAKRTTGGPELRARPTAFVEDCAVPVAQMPAFIDDFRAVLDAAGLTYGMFGHADVGCVHVRPALDLTSGTHRALLASVTQQVTDLVTGYGGLLWGEHGRGLRGASAAQVLTPATHELMRAVKTAFDPTDLMNPGKLYRPLGVDAELTPVDGAPLRGARDQAVDLPTRRTYDSAFACNGNGLCQNYSATDVMCPSYTASGDPALSPKGRADLIREWLANRRGDRQFEDALAENLHQCLSCSACTGHCPVEVDIPELKSRFFEQYYQSRASGRPRSHQLLSRFEQAAWFAGLVPPALARRFTGPLGRMIGLADLPGPHQRRRRHTAFADDQSNVDVVIMPDVFTGALEAETLDATIALLAAMGLTVSVAPFVGSGKFDHVKGDRTRFARAVKQQRAMVGRIQKTGAAAVVIEPAIALLHQHEYPQSVDGYPANGVLSLPELLRRHLDKLAALNLAGEGQTVSLMGHCTERATSPGDLAAWHEVLEAAGFHVERPELGCCGMAGIFGHEVENQHMSRQLWDLSWRPVLDAAGTDAERRAVATGYSCRSQSERFGASRLEHPVHLLVGRS